MASCNELFWPAVLFGLRPPEVLLVLAFVLLSLTMLTVAVVLLLELLAVAVLLLSVTAMMLPLAVVIVILHWVAGVPEVLPVTAAMVAR